MLKLIPNWREIARRAWSFRLVALAGLLTGCELLLPYFAPSLPRGLFAVLTLITCVAAMIARVLAQRNMASGGGAA